jgi:glucosamine-6-phosphate deaminase
VLAYRNSEELFEWCKIPPEELIDHPGAKVKLKIVPAPKDVYRAFADTLIEEVKRNNQAGKPTRWILPCGPRGEYPLFIDQVNRERISLKNVHVFHMDDTLTGRDATCRSTIPSA